MSKADLAVAAASLAVVVWLLTRGDPLYAYFSLFIIPILGFTGGRVVVSWLGETAYRLPRRMRKRWEGFYFEYGSRHLRAVRQRNTLLFYERDILGVLGLKQSRETALFTNEERVDLGRGAGHALTQAGCNRLLRKSAHPDARPLLLHLEREAFAPFAKRLEYERLERSPPSDPAATPSSPEAAAASPQEAGRVAAEGSPNSSDSAAR